MLLKYREEIIAAKVAKEHIEDTLKSEILFLKDRVLAEQQEKNTVEETLSQEVSSLQERLGKMVFIFFKSVIYHKIWRCFFIIILEGIENKIGKMSSNFSSGS